jgi:uncharacterized membrane protein
MIPGDADARRGEQALGWLLKSGVYLASALIAIGLLAGPLSPTRSDILGHRLVRWGIGIFILLPAMRVAFMLIMFVRARNYRLAWVAAAVLLIIATGCILGLVRHGV